MDSENRKDFSQRRVFPYYTEPDRMVSLAYRVSLFSVTHASIRGGADIKSTTKCKLKP